MLLPNCYFHHTIPLPKNYLSVSFQQAMYLWEMGFKYHGFPVVEYIKHNGNQQVHYIYQNQLLTKHFKYDESPMFSSALNAMLRSLTNCNDVLDDYKGVRELRKLF